MTSKRMAICTYGSEGKYLIVYGIRANNSREHFNYEVLVNIYEEYLSKKARTHINKTDATINWISAYYLVTAFDVGYPLSWNIPLHSTCIEQ